MTTAVYPGTFDPLTMGHLDLIRRSTRQFDRVIVAVAGVSMKATSMFDIGERMQMVRECIDEEGIENVTIDCLDRMLVDYCRKHDVRVVVRGLRVYSDFEYEFQMALTNRKMAPEIETLFMMPSENLAYVSSSTVREIARYGGDLSGMVTPAVLRNLKKWKPA